AENPQDEDAKRGKARVGLMQRTSDADVQQVRTNAAEHPDDVEAQLAVADLDLLGGHVKDAFDRLVKFISRSDGEDKDAARAHLRRTCTITRGLFPVRVEYSSGRSICFAPKVLTLVDMLEKTALPDPDHAVVVRSLGKQFGDKVAVNGVNLTIPAGSFYGVV